jgi:hypothetical protein
MDEPVRTPVLVAAASLVPPRVLLLKSALFEIDASLIMSFCVVR